MNEDDLSGLLPKPPPPHPARRDAAIAAAMRRFDGVADTPAEQERPRVRTPLWKARWSQIGAFASVLLVALISIPIALETPPRQSADLQPPSSANGRGGTSGPSAPATAPQTPDNSGNEAGVAEPADRMRTATASAPAVATASENAVPAPADKATPFSETARRGALASRLEEVPSASSEPPPAPAPPPTNARDPSLSAPARVAEARAGAPAPEPSIVITGSRVVRPARESASPVTVVREATAADGDDIVVSGTRSPPRRAAARRGDWNACTVNDPEQSLRGCKRLVNPAVKGAAGRAAARLADGLALAWRQDWDRAIDAFDQAIALDPNSAFAYLNRGLAYQRKGDLSRAAADLDLAVRHAPHAARGYYSRSIVRQLRGDSRGAAVDAARATDLDSRYEAVLD